MTNVEISVINHFTNMMAFISRQQLEARNKAGKKNEKKHGELLFSFLDALHTFDILHTFVFLKH